MQFIKRYINWSKMINESKGERRRSYQLTYILGFAYGLWLGTVLKDLLNTMFPKQTLKERLDHRRSLTHAEELDILASNLEFDRCEHEEADLFQKEDNKLFMDNERWFCSGCRTWFREDPTAVDDPELAHDLFADCYIKNKDGSVTLWSKDSATGHSYDPDDPAIAGWSHYGNSDTQKVINQLKSEGKL